MSATSVASDLRVLNFSAGPAVLPLSVLKQIRDEMLALPGVGSSILEINHRSEPFLAILEDAQQRLRRLLDIPDDYSVLFLQGGSRLQFVMVPMNLARDDSSGAYVVTGTWGQKAVEEGARLGSPRVVWDGRATNYDRLPERDELAVPPQAAYVHLTSNETIQGVQFRQMPDTAGVPLVSDASSDLLSRRIDIRQFGLVYACAQKNAGPAGVTIVIIHRSLVESSREGLPGYLSYRAHAEENSLFNTAPTFAIYVVGLVCRWLEEDMGGIDAMESINRRKAAMLYAALDDSRGFYRGHAQVACRSLTTVPFRLADARLEKTFLMEAAEHQLTGLAGHRSVGGMRAAIYNAMPLAGVEALVDFLRDFARRHG